MLPNAAATYRITTSKSSDCVGSGTVVYGIECSEKTKGGEEAEKIWIEDISDDREFVETLAEILNRGEVELCHFECIVLDYINALEMERKDML